MARTGRQLGSCDWGSRLHCSQAVWLWVVHLPSLGFAFPICKMRQNQHLARQKSIVLGFIPFMYNTKEFFCPWVAKPEVHPRAANKQKKEVLVHRIQAVKKTETLGTSEPETRTLQASLLSASPIYQLYSFSTFLQSVPTAVLTCRSELWLPNGPCSHWPCLSQVVTLGPISCS